MEADPDLKARLTRAIDGLPEGYRTVFVMHDVEGYTHEEIADDAGRAARHLEGPAVPGPRPAARGARRFREGLSMTDDDPLDEPLRAAAREYHRPPEPPREAMWRAIEAGAPARTGPAARAAALDAVGRGRRRGAGGGRSGIGRLSQPTARTRDRAGAVASGRRPPRRA